MRPTIEELALRRGNQKSQAGPPLTVQYQVLIHVLRAGHHCLRSWCGTDAGGTPCLYLSNVWLCHFLEQRASFTKLYPKPEALL